MSAKKKFKTVDEYIESQPEDTRRTLLALREIIMEAVPDATELFNYDMPAYALVVSARACSISSALVSATPRAA